jgi:hypothetical protein
MRNGQNKRMRGRNNQHHRKGHQNPMSRVYESNGPDVKIRGTPSHIAEKYVQLARDAQSSGDPVSAENYYQHAEHYFRLIAAAQEQFRQNNPNFARPDNDTREESFEDGDEGGFNQQPTTNDGEPPFGVREPQPYLPRDAQPFPQQQQQRQPQQQGGHEGGGNVDRLPSFITGGQPQQAQGGSQPQQGQNGHDNQGDRFPLHRRRRRHRGGPRNDMQGAPQPDVGDGDDSSARD